MSRTIHAQNSLWDKTQLGLFKETVPRVSQLDLMPQVALEEVSFMPIEQQCLIGKAVQLYYLPTPRSRKPRKGGMRPMLTAQGYRDAIALKEQEGWHKVWYEAY